MRPTDWDGLRPMHTQLRWSPAWTLAETALSIVALGGDALTVLPSVVSVTTQLTAPELCGT